LIVADAPYAAPPLQPFLHALALCGVMLIFYSLRSVQGVKWPKITGFLGVRGAQAAKHGANKFGG
jgi:hypothetical protein